MVLINVPGMTQTVKSRDSSSSGVHSSHSGITSSKGVTTINMDFPDSSGSAAADLLAGVNWDIEHDIFLADFVDKFTLPHLGLITRGQYLNIGAPNVANPKLKPYVLIYGRRKVRKVLANLVRIKDGRKTILSKYTVAIPEGYRGFFEILSEEGKPAKCFQSVSELSQRSPDMCMVRSQVKAYLPDKDGELRSLFRSRSIDDGELLTLVGLFNYNNRLSFLRCFDESGQSVYLKLGQKGKFSPIANEYGITAQRSKFTPSRKDKPDDVTGLHYIRNLLDYKRFPLTVKLASGHYPPELKAGHGTPVLNFRLKSIILEESVMVYALQKKWEILSVPLNAFLKVAPCTNPSDVTSKRQFCELINKCEEFLPDYINRITIVNEQQVPDNCLNLDRLKSVSSHDLGRVSKKSPEDARTEIVISDEEIDQLYDYIRGMAPAPEDKKERRKSGRKPKGPLPKPPEGERQKKKPPCSEETVHLFIDESRPRLGRLSKSTDRLLSDKSLSPLRESSDSFGTTPQMRQKSHGSSKTPKARPNSMALSDEHNLRVNRKSGREFLDPRLMGHPHGPMRMSQFRSESEFPRTPLPYPLRIPVAQPVLPGNRIPLHPHRFPMGRFF